MSLTSAVIPLISAQEVKQSSECGGGGGGGGGGDGVPHGALNAT